MKTKILLLTLITGLFALSCNNKKENTESGEHEVLPANTVEMNDAQYKSAGIELGFVEQKVLNNELKVNGLINVPPQNTVTVSAILGGYIKSTNLVQGSPVSIGQVLAVIENPEFIELQQNYLESKSKLEYAETEYNRQKDLYKENVNSEKTCQLAMSEYKTLKTTVYALEQKLKITGIDVTKLKDEKISGTISLLSPINGYVKTVNANIGKYVNPTDIIFEIVNTQKLTLELTVFERDIDKISIGQNINFISPNNTAKKQTAVIYQVGKTINDDKTVKVYANINNDDKDLLPGMYVNALIETESDSTMALPDGSILTFEDKNYIFIFSERKKEGEKFVTLFQLTEVEKGISNNGYTEVILPKDFDLTKSKVVIKGAYNLLSAMKNAGDMAC